MKKQDPGEADYWRSHSEYMVVKTTLGIQILECNQYPLFLLVKDFRKSVYICYLDYLLTCENLHALHRTYLNLAYGLIEEKT